MRRNEYDHANNRYQRRFLEERFKNLEISRAEAPYLVKIKIAGGHMKMNDLVCEVFFHKSHTTRAINRLLEDGFIIKEKNPEDQRGYILSLTEKGLETANKVESIFVEWDKLINTVITDEEREMLKNITIRIYHLLREYYDEEDTISENNI